MIYVKQSVNVPQLRDEIQTAGLPAPLDVSIEDVNLTITYDPELSEQDLATLAGVVDAHVADPAYVTLAARAQIATLTSYLNSPTASVAATARARIVANIAPRLPPDLVATINAQIAAIINP